MSFLNRTSWSPAQSSLIDFLRGQTTCTTARSTAPCEGYKSREVIGTHWRKGTRESSPANGRCNNFQRLSIVHRCFIRTPPFLCFLAASSLLSATGHAVGYTQENRVTVFDSSAHLLTRLAWRAYRPGRE